MGAPQKISICIPTLNGAATIGRCLRAALSQDCPIPYDLLLIDSGSTDGTLELAGSFPVRIRKIHKGEFNHGDTRNLGVSLTTGEIVVFLTQDAIPADSQWLMALVREFTDPQVAGAYSRNVPHPESNPIVASGLSRDPSGQPGRREQQLLHGELATLDPTQRRLRFDFNDVSSAIRRDVWNRFPFPRTAFGEDVLFARGVIEAGFKIIYTPDSKVFHGHDDPPPVSAERARVDGEFNAVHLDRICIRSFPDAIRTGLRVAWADHKFLKHAVIPRGLKWRERLRAPRLRISQMVGLWAGGRARRRATAPVMLDRERLRVLYVVHGYPPESVAGTEVYTYNLAREVHGRGHTTGVFYRSIREEIPEFGLQEADDQGIQLFRLKHGLEFQHAGESYSHPVIEARFREVLDRFRPDIVHFNHLLHLSARLVPMARERGAATIITLHDFWAVCPRVQLQRPNGVNCGGRKELGCLLCLKHRHLNMIDWVARGTRLFRPVVERMVRRYETMLQEGRPLARRKRDIVAIYRRDRTVLDSFASADLMIAPSRFLRDLLLSDVPTLDPEKVIFSEHGMKTDGIHALPKVPDALGRVRFGFLGSLVPYKGVGVAISAMLRLNDPRAVLLIFGRFDPETDPYHKQLLELAKSRPDCNIEFCGPVDHARIATAFSRIDALVVPSTWYENAPLTIREAHLAGTPTIVSDLGGMAESVREGVDGMRFRTGDPGSLATVMLQLISNPATLAGLSRDFIERKTAREGAAEMEFRYRGLVAGRRATVLEPIAEFRGSNYAQKLGNVETQGDGIALIRAGGGGGYLEYRVKTNAGDASLRIETLVLGPERETPVAGTVHVNGEIAGSLPVAVSRDDRDTVQEWVGIVRMRSGRNVIRIYNHLPDGREVFLRVRRVVLRRERARNTLQAP